LKCGDGVVVDDAMRTSDPSIFAIGEVAEHRGQRHGTTLAAQQQADVAAAQLSGDVWTRYAGSVPVHIVKVRGLALAAIGKTVITSAAADEYEIERLYLKCFVQRNRLVGAILAGDVSRLPQFKAWIEGGIELDGERRKLLRLRSDASAPAPKGRLVCSCLQVGEGNLRDAIATGCATLDRVCETTGAGTGCGSCRPEIVELLQHPATVQA
jgi:ferredoxin-nitrate reductase